MDKITLKKGLEDIFDYLQNALDEAINDEDCAGCTECDEEEEGNITHPIASCGYIDDSNAEGKARAKVITYILDSYKADHTRYDRETAIALAKIVSKTLDYIPTAEI